MPLAIERLFDNVATQDFDDQGSYYPDHLLPRSDVTTENVHVRPIDFPFQFVEERLREMSSVLSSQLGKWTEG